MRKWTWLLTFFLLLAPLTHAAEKVIVLPINEPIGPATEDYIQRGIAYAVEQQATAIILEMNTPGGLDSSTRAINEDIITSPIPIITYVAPAGARAASAGTFIMYASHLAAMAPGTNVGAASPVQIGGSAEKTDKLSTSEQKAMNDAAAYIRSLAQLRVRNVTWAENAVRKAESLSAEEAKKLNVINEIAADYTQLLEKLDGHTAVVLGAPETVKTKDAQIIKMAGDWRHDFLSFLTNPNIAYILMLIAMYGLFFEFSNPGAVLPGVAGIIALLLVLYAFQLMPINYAGLSLIIIGISFMIAELYISSFGVLGIGGAIAFILGSIMLFDMNNPYYQLNLTLIFLMSAITIGFFLLIATLALRAQKSAVITGKEALLGKEGIVISTMNEQVVVRIGGEIWDARSVYLLNAGQHVKVVGIHGLILEVKPTDPKELLRS